MAEDSDSVESELLIPEKKLKAGDEVLVTEKNDHVPSFKGVILSVDDTEVRVRLKKDNGKNPHIYVFDIKDVIPIQKDGKLFDTDKFLEIAKGYSIRRRTRSAQVFLTGTHNYRSIPEVAIALWKMNMEESDGFHGSVDLGNYYMSQGDHEKALEVFRAASDTNPCATFSTACIMEQHHKDYEGAFDMYNKCIRVSEKVAQSASYYQVHKYDAINTLSEFYLIGRGCYVNLGMAFTMAKTAHDYGSRIKDLNDNCLPYYEQFATVYSYCLLRGIGCTAQPQKALGIISNFKRLHLPRLLWAFHDIESTIVTPTDFDAGYALLPNQNLARKNLRRDKYSLGITWEGRSDHELVSCLAPIATYNSEKILTKMRMRYDNYDWNNLVEFNRQNQDQIHCRTLLIYCYAYGILNQKQDIAQVVSLIRDSKIPETVEMQAQLSHKVYFSWKNWLEIRTESLKVPDSILFLILTYELSLLLDVEPVQNFDFVSSELEQRVILN